MKIPDDIKLDIQCFIYFFFKGTLDPRLIEADFYYLDKLLQRKELLLDCFEIFTYVVQELKDVRPNELVADYILAQHASFSERLH